MTGLTDEQAAAVRAEAGPNAVRSHRARPVAVLLRQLRSPLLMLLLVAATVSFFVGERTDAVVIGVIVALSVGLGFANEYRAERAVEALHEHLRSRARVLRGGALVERDVTELVPGDVVELRLGAVVPADVELAEARDLECDESVLTGESLPVRRKAGDTALMGTVVTAGTGTGTVSGTGARTAFGAIAAGLGERHAETAFQIGLRRFSGLLVSVAAALTAGVFATNLVMGRPLLDAMLFSLAIAVGVTPQLLPAVVTTGLATGSRRLTRRKVLVKRLVAIEDLGDVEVLFTDKTGTLTQAGIALRQAVRPDGTPDPGDPRGPFRLGVLCADPPGSGALDDALHDALDRTLNAGPRGAGAAMGEWRPESWRRLDAKPFDHGRRMASVLVEDPAGESLTIVKGAPEAVLARCREVPEESRALAERLFAEGARLVAVATRPGARELVESDLDLAGFLVFSDPPKPGVGEALRRLAALGITVKILTGDHPAVATGLCGKIGLPVAGVLTGEEVERLDDAALTDALPATTVFARVSPEQKARIVGVQRNGGLDVAYLGDGVNDALALHRADVGISVDTGADVARDAADVVLLEKDLGVLADGIVEGRRIFANTVKYLLMGTASNVGNMFSAAAASAVLPFLPMLPSQVLLNNLLYDAGQLAIPADAVDPEQIARPARFDLGLIRRFMLVFGPLSSMFDLAMFALLLRAFHAAPPLFRASWFVESLATQTLVIFIVRTRRTPFWRSRPATALVIAVGAVVAAGVALPYTPFASELGLAPVPPAILAVIAVVLVVYLALVEVAKRRFRTAPAPRVRRQPPHRRVHRRATPFSRGLPVRPAGVRAVRRRAPAGRGRAG
ncbi:magnesium-translocating P-type ATPase [Microbispora sp. ATCC PTA-5024]|uniref:magnesium-translocating P-type ATPase n=1 Tax=Microbispora sp. ATCC PTA-5024 TaxID=316330 RepID=UPI0018DC0530|nr:magnesium-translocating P-type ATPase [Microbispora sp. ATCC PTA-5024]